MAVGGPRAAVGGPRATGAPAEGDARSPRPGPRWAPCMSPVASGAAGGGVRALRPRAAGRPAAGHSWPYQMHVCAQQRLVAFFS